MKQLIFLIIAVVLAIAATVLAFIFVVPEKRREKLNAFGKFLHDLCSFKFLVVEKILQALYIFSTAFIVLYGVLQLFNVEGLLDRRKQMDGRYRPAVHHRGTHRRSPQL